MRCFLVASREAKIEFAVFGPLEVGWRWEGKGGK